MAYESPAFKQMNQEFNQLIDECEQISEKAMAEQRDFTPEEHRKVDMNHAKVEELKLKMKTQKLSDARMEQKAGNVLGAKLAQDMADMGEDISFRSGGDYMRNHRGETVTVLNRADSYAKSLGGNAVSTGLGETIRALVCGTNKHTPSAIKAALSEGNNLAGGFLVPNPLAATVIDKARAQAVTMRAGAQTIVMDSQDLFIASVVGDPTFQAKAENEAFTPSTITFGGIYLNTHTIGTVIECSRELAEDAPNFAQVVEDVLAKSLAVQLDSYAINGLGTSTGLVTNQNISETGSIGAIDWLDLSTAANTIRVANEEPNGAIMYPSIHNALNTIETGDGTNSARGWLGPPPALAGVSNYHTTLCPSANVIVGDFTKMLWGLRHGVRIESTTVAGDSFKKHQVWFKIVWRGDWAITRAAAFHRLAGVTAS